MLDCPKEQFFVLSLPRTLITYLIYSVQYASGILLMYPLRLGCLLDGIDLLLHFQQK